MLVQEFLTRTASRLPEKVGLVCDGRRYTYAELDGLATKIAQTLIRNGVKRGDRVAIALPNSLEAVVGIFGILKADAVFVVLNPSTRQEKLTRILRDCGAAGLMVSPQPKGLDLDRILADIPSLAICVLCGRRGVGPRTAGPVCFTFSEIQGSTHPSALPCAAIDLDLACLVYTSGSTGEPKGVMCDHAAVDFVSTSIMTFLESDERDVVINCLPLAFDYGLYQLLMTFKCGGTLVLERSFSFPAEILRHIGEEGVTGFPGVPMIFAMMLQMDLGAFDLSTLRYLTNTAAALPPSHVQELRRRLPGVAIHSMYGLTETKRTLHLPPDQIDMRPASVGVAIPGTEVWIEDAAGARLGTMETGELVVRGRHVMRGYWQDPEATALRFPPGPLPGERVCRSGDLFRMDAEGYFYFVARTDDMIKCRGEKVAPREVENVLHQLPGVIAAVIGIPDPVLGEAVMAFIVAGGPPLTEAQVLAHCKAHLEEFMVPKFIEFRTELPLSPSGKVRKDELARALELAGS